MKALSLVTAGAAFAMVLVATGCGENSQTSTNKENENRSATTPRTSDRDSANNGMRSSTTTSGVNDAAVDRARTDNMDKQAAGNKADSNGIAKPINTTATVDRPSPIDTRPESTLVVPDTAARDMDANDSTKPRAADNSGQNETDKAGTSVTPLDQGASESDIAVTRTIRQAVTGDSTLSTNAQNIKIITRDGMVVLRGPVASQTEVDAIMSHARTAAGATRIDNQLAVTAP